MLCYVMDNAIPMRKIRPGADCFAALDVLPVAPLRERLQSGGRCLEVLLGEDKQHNGRQTAEKIRV